MALITLAVYDTDENKRSGYTAKTLESLLKTVNFNKHRLIIVDNNSIEETKNYYLAFKHFFKYDYPDGYLKIILLDKNIGTAEAVNIGWKDRRPGENAVKMDNDVVIHSAGWIDKLEEAIKREPKIGQIGLKRRDCWETPTHKNAELRSKLFMIPHLAGERWIVIEQSKHIIGTCVLHSSALLDRVGYLFQPGLYGYDDVLMSWRANLAGFICCFLPEVEIDHIDDGSTPFQKWKESHSGGYSREVSNIVDEYIDGTRSLYYAPPNIAAAGYLVVG